MFEVSDYWKKLSILWYFEIFDHFHLPTPRRFSSRFLPRLRAQIPTLTTGFQVIPRVQEAGWYRRILLYLDENIEAAKRDELPRSSVPYGRFVDSMLRSEGEMPTTNIHCLISAPSRGKALHPWRAIYLDSGSNFLAFGTTCLCWVCFTLTKFVGRNFSGRMVYIAFPFKPAWCSLKGQLVLRLEWTSNVVFE